MLGTEIEFMPTPSAAFDIALAVIIGICSTPIVLLLMLWHVVTAYIPRKFAEVWNHHVG
jgi:hypothetical protein